MVPSGERLEPIIASLCGRIFRPSISSISVDFGDLKQVMKFETQNRGVVFAGQKLSAYAVVN
jgi:hypothetical protein